ncbi:MAG: hypothetical protein AAFN79_12020 [Pseudomonadota bacterium]
MAFVFLNDDELVVADSNSQVAETTDATDVGPFSESLSPDDQTPGYGDNLIPPPTRSRPVVTESVSAENAKIETIDPPRAESAKIDDRPASLGEAELSANQPSHAQATCPRGLIDILAGYSLVFSPGSASIEDDNWAEILRAETPETACTAANLVLTSYAATFEHETDEELWRLSESRAASVASALENVGVIIEPANVHSFLAEERRDFDQNAPPPWRVDIWLDRPPPLEQE